MRPVRELLGPLRRRRAAPARLRRGARRRARAGLPRGPARRQRRPRRGCGWSRCASTRSSCAARPAPELARGAAAGRPRARGAPAGARPAARTCSWPGACAPRSRSAGAARRRAPAANGLPAQRPAPRRRPSGGSCARSAARYDRVVALSGAVAARSGPRPARSATRLRVCHPGVDLERFSALPGLSSPEQALLLGAIVDWKRPDLALEAVAIAARELPGLRLRVAGAPLDGRGEELLAPPARQGRAARPGGARGAERARRRRRGAARRRPACSTARTASRSGWWCSRRSPRRGPWWRPPPAGRRSCSTTAWAGSIRPATRRRRPPGSSRCWRDPELASRLGAGGPAPRRGPPRPRERRRAAGARPWLRPRRPPRAPARAWRWSPSRTTRSASWRALLRSVERHLPAARVVVVDSGSSDGSVAVARARRRAGRACSSWTTWASAPRATAAWRR